MPAPQYNQIRQKSSHNSFQRREAIVDQLIYHRIRSVEFDIHHSKGAANVDGDWFVYHIDLLDDDTTCTMLSDCLAEMAAFHAAVPDHEVVTLWIDLKDPFNPTHQPADLDALLTTVLPPGSVVTARDLLDACPGADTLQQAVTGACAWPELDELRGRFIAVLTGGDVSAPDTKLSEYLAAGDPRAHAAFVAPDLAGQAPLPDNPSVVFLNMNTGDAARAADVFAAGYIGRVWGVNSEGAWDEAAQANTHHIATDKVNYHQDPWAITHDARGWPFTCIGDCPAFGPEPAAIIGVDVSSGDLWDNADSFVFAYTDQATTEDASWSAFISTVNSHVEEFAKGCLMARASLDPGSPYFAVCRPADDHRLRVQRRTQAGASSQETEADITMSGTIAPESVMYVRLDVSAGATCATGFGSQDGARWVEIAAQCFDEPLTLHGLAASSHDGGSIRFLFGQPRRAIGAQTETFTATDLGPPTAIGASAVGVAYDGVLP